MADFKTHLIGAAVVSGASATLLSMAAQVSGSIDIDDEVIIGLFAAGVVGGLLPDVDVETSVPIRMARRIVTTLGTLLAVLRFAARFSLIELALVAVGTFIVLEAAFELFGRATSHRGLVHSLPAGAAFGLGTAMVAHRVLGADPVESWLYATFLCLGFVAHLILDEIYAVDVMGASLKQSFGSALSLGDRGNILGTGALYLAVALLLQACPPADGFLTIASDAATYRAVVDRILPEGSWFT